MSRIACAWMSSMSSNSIRPCAGDVDGLRRPDQRDDLVERVERLDQAAQDVGPLVGLAQPVGGPADDDVQLVHHVQPDQLVDAQRARDAVDDRQHVRAEAGLQLGVLVEVVQHHLRHGVALDLDDDAHADPVAALVLDVGDAGELAVADLVGDRGDEVVVVDLVGQLGDDQQRAALASPPRSRRRRACGWIRGPSCRRRESPASQRSNRRSGSQDP